MTSSSDGSLLALEIFPASGDPVVLSDDFVDDELDDDIVDNKGD